MPKSYLVSINRKKSSKCFGLVTQKLQFKKKWGLWDIFLLKLAVWYIPWQKCKPQDRNKSIQHFRDKSDMFINILSFHWRRSQWEDVEKWLPPPVTSLTSSTSLEMTRRMSSSLLKRRNTPWLRRRLRWRRRTTPTSLRRPSTPWAPAASCFLSTSGSTFSTSSSPSSFPSSVPCSSSVATGATLATSPSLPSSTTPGPSSSWRTPTTPPPPSSCCRWASSSKSSQKPPLSVGLLDLWFLLLVLCSLPRLRHHRLPQASLVCYHQWHHHHVIIMSFPSGRGGRGTDRLGVACASLQTTCSAGGRWSWFYAVMCFNTFSHTVCFFHM